jgi:hypothetical protein
VDNPAKHIATVETLAAPKNNSQCKEMNTPFKSQTLKTFWLMRKEVLEKYRMPTNPIAAITQRKKTIVSAFACVALPKMAVNAYSTTMKWIFK